MTHDTDMPSDRQFQAHDELPAPEPSEADRAWHAARQVDRVNRFAQRLFDAANRILGTAECDDFDAELAEELAQLGHTARWLDAESWSEFRARRDACLSR